MNLLHFFRFYEHGYTENNSDVYSLERWIDHHWLDNIKLTKYIYLCNAVDIVMESMLTHYVDDRNKLTRLNIIKSNYIICTTLKQINVLIYKRVIPFIYQYRHSKTVYYIVFANHRLKNEYFGLIHDDKLRLFHMVTLEYTPQKIKLDIDMPHGHGTTTNTNFDYNNEHTSRLILCFREWLHTWIVDTFNAAQDARVGRIDDEVFAEFVKYVKREHDMLVGQSSMFDVGGNNSRIEYLKKLMSLDIDTYRKIIRSARLSKDDVTILVTAQGYGMKWSYHIIIDGVYCNNVHEVKRVVGMIRDALMFTHMHVFNKYIDMEIYKKTQHFRHLGSAKECNGEITRYKRAIRDQEHIDIDRFEINNTIGCKLMPTLLSADEYTSLTIKYVVNSEPYQHDKIDFMNSYFVSHNMYVKFSSYEQPFYKFERYASGWCDVCKKTHHDRGVTAILTKIGIKWRCDFTDNAYRYIVLNHDSSYSGVQTVNVMTSDVDLRCFYNVRNIDDPDVVVMYCLYEHVDILDVSNAIIYNTSYHSSECMYEVLYNKGRINNAKVLDTIIDRKHNVRGEFRIVMPYGTVDAGVLAHDKGHNANRYYLLCTHADLLDAYDKGYLFAFLNVNGVTDLTANVSNDHIEKIKARDKALNDEIDSFILACL